MPVTLSSGSFYGTVARRRKFSDFTLTQTAYQPQARIPGHTHEHPYFCFVLGGSFDETSGGRTSECGSQDVVFHPSGEVHSNRFHRRGGYCFNLELGERFVERLQDYGSFLKQPAKYRSGPAGWLCMRMHREFHRRDSAAPLAIEGLALELVSEFLRRPSGCDSGNPPWIAGVRDLLHSRFAEPLTLAEIARSADVHPAHLARGFRLHLRTTVGEYVRQLRIDYACRLLTRDDSALSEIAASAGFADQSHFTRIFRRMTGLTPARYRALRSPGHSRTKS